MIFVFAHLQILIICITHHYNGHYEDWYSNQPEETHDDVHTISSSILIGLCVWTGHHWSNHWIKGGKNEINKYSFIFLKWHGTVLMHKLYVQVYAYAALSCGIPMALRTKLRSWKNNTKKIHIKVKKLSFLEMCGGREGGREREREREREEEGEGERERGAE